MLMAMKGAESLRPVRTYANNLPHCSYVSPTGGDYGAGPTFDYSPDPILLKAAKAKVRFGWFEFRLQLSDLLDPSLDPTLTTCRLPDGCSFCQRCFAALAAAGRHTSCRWGCFRLDVAIVC